MVKSPRVVITGMGTVNPLGNNVEEFWTNSVQGNSGVRNITKLFSIPEHMSQIAGVTKIPFEEGKNTPQLRNQIFADQAVQEAFDYSQLQNSEIDRSKCAVFIATAIAEISLMEETFGKYKNEKWHVDFVSKKHSYHGKSFFFNSMANEIASKYFFRGGAVTIATGCTGGNDAVGYAMHMIRSGRIDVAITGAVEAPITPLVVAAFSKIGATSKRNHEPQAASRPFDLDRDGFVLAEGSGILILENFDHAKKRGAPILAEILGMGSVNNCYHMTDIPEDGLSIAKACKLALKDAQISPDSIDFINAHGSSTPQNDVAESNAIHEVFGSRASQIPVTSIKSQLGHALSAANCIELISSVLSLRDHVIPPTINLNNKDHRCSLAVVGNNPIERVINTVLKPSSGFSGIHSCLLLQKVMNQ